VAVLPGNGAGGFAAPVLSGTVGWPLAAADLDGDGRLDVLAQTDSALVVLPGNGDGTLGAARSIVGTIVEFAIPADLDGDGVPDVVAGEQGDLLHIFPGNGDFTFGPRVTLTTGTWPHGATVADFDDDGRRDIAVAHRYDTRLVVFMNGGGLLFTRTDIPIGAPSTDVTARHLDSDGYVDLIASVRGDSPDGPWEFGAVHVFRGNGDGTFEAPEVYPTANGPHSVVVGDFTHDGRLDLATSDGFQYLLDNMCGESVGPETVSILPGRSDGTFGPPTTFVRNSRELLPGVRNMNTSDVDGDGFHDLLVGWGDIFVTKAPRANRPPVVFAGDDLVVANAPEITLRGEGVDPDGHYLTFTWDDGGAGGDFFAQAPDTCYRAPRTGAFTLTLTADDSQGGVSSDSLNVSDMGDIDGPGFWRGEDIGAVGAEGSVTVEDGTFTVRGSGADIWGTADEFYFTHATRSGDFDFTALVAGVQNVNRWTKAGLMIRAAEEAGSAHASVFATPTTEKGIAFQRRRSDGGASVHTSGPALAPPVWLRLSRRGSTITAAYRRTATDEWTTIGSDSIELPDRVLVGLAVSSHVDGTLAAARFQQLSIAAPGTTPGLPDGWFCGDVGAVGAEGDCDYHPAVGDDLTDRWVVHGSGADIWGPADEFSFAATLMRGDFAVTARVASVENVDRWTKAGIMIRDWDGRSPAGGGPGARHASFFVTPTTVKGTAFQRRPTTGGPSVHTAGPVTTAPVWLRLVRRGNSITAFYRKQTIDPWTHLGTQTFTGLPDPMMAMLVVSSHVDGTLATASFEHVRVESLPAMQSADIGPTAAGSTVSDGTIVRMDGNGADIWGTADAFRFHYVPWAGDGTIIARVRSLENTHRWAKAGVMFREALTPGSRHVMAIVSPSMGLAMQYRSETGGASASTAPVPGNAPVWVRLRRFADRFEASWSADGEVWQFLGEARVSMSRDVYVGLPLTSHAAGTLATAVFDDLVITAR
jgi:regulation of enolase protein 1 (concanavalin A-like superfamily)